MGPLIGASSVSPQTNKMFSHRSSMIKINLLFLNKWHFSFAVVFSGKCQMGVEKTQLFSLSPNPIFSFSTSDFLPVASSFPH